MPFSSTDQRNGSGHLGKSAEVSVAVLNELKVQPLPITIGGTSGRTFTVVGSESAPAIIPFGNGVIPLVSSVAYSWVEGTNTILDSTGAEDTQTNGLTGVWYYYIDADGNTILPSQTAPAYDDSQYGVGELSHPGTSKAKAWRYVGWTTCTATDPTFATVVKGGYTYYIDTPLTKATPGTSWASSAFTGETALPTHGVRATIGIESGAAGYVFVSPYLAGNGQQEVGSNTASEVLKASVQMDIVDGQIYCKDTVARGDLFVQAITDVV